MCAVTDGWESQSIATEELCSDKDDGGDDAEPVAKEVDSDDAEAVTTDALTALATSGSRTESTDHSAASRKSWPSPTGAQSSSGTV